MGSFLINLLASIFWSLLFFAEVDNVFCTQINANVSQATAVVNASFTIATTDDDYVCATLDWWPPDKCDYGSCSWGFASILNLNLSNPILFNAIKAFSPLKVRLGGTLQDKVIYDVGDPGQPCIPFTKNTSELFGFTEGCLPMSRWDDLNDFFKKSGAVIFFGLNALNGRVPLSDGSLGGPWNSTNAAALIRYTINKGYTIHGWEFGNELSGSGIGTRVGADQYAEDTISLKSIIDNLYQGFPSKPLVIAPGGLFDATWYSEFINKTKPKSLDVVTYHIYNLGSGGDPDLVQKILNPDVLDYIKKTYMDVHNILESAGTKAVAWVGEAGGTYNSGQNLVSNAFIFSFWYLDQLGMAATYDTKSYCRQSLIGGYYGLLDTTTFVPNPDYYSALLWHRLMGRNALSTSIIGTNKIRAYAHCARQSQGITLLLINLDGNTTTQVTITTKPSEHHDYNNRTSKAKDKTSAVTREEYHLTAQNGDLHSRTMLLNGKILAIDQNGGIPDLEPVKVDGSKPIDVSPYSIKFVHLPYLDAPACK